MITFASVVAIGGIGGAALFEIWFLLRVYGCRSDPFLRSTSELVTAFLGHSNKRWHGLSWRADVHYLLSFCGFVTSCGLILVPPLSLWLFLVVIIASLFIPLFFLFLPAWLVYRVCSLVQVTQQYWRQWF